MTAQASAAKYRWPSLLTKRRPFSIGTGYFSPFSAFGVIRDRSVFEGQPLTLQTLGDTVRILTTVILLALTPLAFSGDETNPAPTLTQENLNQWVRFLRPNDQELLWQQVRWHKDYETAVKEARQLKRPILLWAMNGHPCGET